MTNSKQNVLILPAGYERDHEDTPTFYRFANLIDLQTVWHKWCRKKPHQKIYIHKYSIRGSGIKATSLLLPPQMWQMNNWKVVALCVVAAVYIQSSFNKFSNHIYQQVTGKRLSLHQTTSVLSILIKRAQTRSFTVVSIYKRRDM